MGLSLWHLTHQFFYDELLLVHDQPTGRIIHTPSPTRDCLFALHPRVISSIRNVGTRHVAFTGGRCVLKLHRNFPNFDAERPVWWNHYAVSQWVNSSKRNAMVDYSAPLLWIREVLYSNLNPQTSCRKTPLSFRLFHQYLKITRSSSLHTLAALSFT